LSLPDGNSPFRESRAEADLRGLEPLPPQPALPQCCYFTAKEETVLVDAVAHGRLVAGALAGQGTRDGDPWSALRQSLQPLAGAADADALRTMRVLLSTPSLRARSMQKHRDWADTLVPILRAGRSLGEILDRAFRAVGYRPSATRPARKSPVTGARARPRSKFKIFNTERAGRLPWLLGPSGAPGPFGRVPCAHLRRVAVPGCDLMSLALRGRGSSVSFGRCRGCCIFGVPGFLVLPLAELFYGTPVQAG